MRYMFYYFMMSSRRYLCYEYIPSINATFLSCLSYVKVTSLWHMNSTVHPNSKVPLSEFFVTSVGHSGNVFNTLYGVYQMIAEMTSLFVGEKKNASQLVSSAN